MNAMRIAAFCGAVLSAAANAGEFSANGCRVEWDGTSLTVGNRLFSRGYAVSNGVLRTVSLKAAEGVDEVEVEDKGDGSLLVRAQRGEYRYWVEYEFTEDD